MNIFENNINIEGRQRQSLSVSTSAASTTNPLDPGTYAVWADVDTSIRVDVDKSVASAVTVANGFPINSGDPVMPVRITRPAFLGGIASGSGSLYYHKIA